MPTIQELVDGTAARTGFSGVVRVDGPDGASFSGAYGFADRAHELPNTPETRFGIASGLKSMTALTVMSLVEDGTLTMDTTARSILGEDLPLIDDRVTIEQLLAHRSGIGDYLDEHDGHEVTDYVMPVPVHLLATAENYLAVLGGHPTAFPPGERFTYCNGGYVVLAIVAERASGIDYHELVQRRVCEPAGMSQTAFLRSDELPRDAALGYLSNDSPRTNVLHLPVVGTGDGGIYSTVADIRSLWVALFDGRILSPEAAHDMVRPRSDVPEEESRYGLGYWLHATSDTAMMEGYDAGVSFRSVHDPSSGATHTVISNSSEGAWDLTFVLDEHLGL